MTKRERLMNAIQKKPVDKVPVGFWHHFDKSVPLEKMVEFHMDWFKEAGLDFVKIMCDGYFSYPNPGIEDVTCPEDWYNLKPMGENHPFIREQVERAKAIVKAINGEACAFYNVFCPMSLMRFGTSEEILMSHIKANPDAVRYAFSVIAEDVKTLVRLLITEAGCDGIYFCVQNAEQIRFTAEEYRSLVTPAELDVLNYANTLSDMNMLHCCGYAGDKNRIEVWKDYPAAVINWAVYIEGMSLSEGKEFFDNKPCVLGGFDNRAGGPLASGTKEEVEAEVEKVLAEAGTTGVIIGADCTLPRTISAERVRWISDKVKAMSNAAYEKKTWGDFDLSLIDSWIDAHREEMLEDIKRIARIASVSTPSEPKDPEAPFGKGCREALDEMLQIGKEHGFFVKNFDNYVGCISSVDFDTEDMQQHMENTIGFWNHLDVVPVGNNWVYEPFNPTMVEQFMVGRGVDDNKAPAIAMLYIMQCFRELGLSMNHEFCLFVGCDEERGMEDMEYYVGKYPTPKMSIIADAGFPVRYGEKGIIEGQLVTKEALSDNIAYFQGGVASNMIPDKVTIDLKGDEAFKETLLAELKLLEGTEEGQKIEVICKDDVVEIIYHGISKHSAFPEGSSNAIHGMCKVLLGLTVLCESDRKILESVAKLSEEYYGVNTGIAYEDEMSGKTTCAATILEVQEGKISLNLNIRYAITADSDKDLAALARTAEENDMVWVLENNSKPNYFPKEHPAVEFLTDIYNYLANDNRESAVMGGGTYARKLPNAFAYGMGYTPSEEDRADKARLFKPGHGGAHGPDETLNTNTYFKAAKLFAKAMVAMNKIEL